MLAISTVAAPEACAVARTDGRSAMASAHFCPKPPVYRRLRQQAEHSEFKILEICWILSNAAFISSAGPGGEARTGHLPLSPHNPAPPPDARPNAIAASVPIPTPISPDTFFYPGAGGSTADAVLSTC